MKMKAKLVKLTELPGGILCAQFENREGPHTIVHGTPEEFGVIGMSPDEHIGREFTVTIGVEVLIPKPSPANAATPPAAPNAGIGTERPKTAPEANTGVSNPSTVAAVTLPGHVGTIGGSSGGANTEIPGAVTLAPASKAKGGRLPRVTKVSELPEAKPPTEETSPTIVDSAEKSADGTAAAQ